MFNSTVGNSTNNIETLPSTKPIKSAFDMVTSIPSLLLMGALLMVISLAIFCLEALVKLNLLVGSIRKGVVTLVKRTIGFALKGIGGLVSLVLLSLLFLVISSAVLVLDFGLGWGAARKDWASQVNKASKRVFDIIVSVTALIFLSLPMLLVALAVYLTDRGPIFYVATRVGLNGKDIRIYKFRSMVVGADEMGPKITGADDDRITKIGYVLRKTKLDELPQLFNVVRGDMSLVGPRPENRYYVDMYSEEQRNLILSVRPGITGAASVVYRNEEEILAGSDRELIYINEVMPAKLAIDMEYVKKVSIIQDIKIMIATVQAL